MRNMIGQCLPLGDEMTDVAATQKNEQVSHNRKMAQRDTASDASAEEAEEEYSIRKSKRVKRSRSEWDETLVMQVRRSRASGDSKKIAVTTRGGKPSHKKKSRKTKVNVVRNGKPADFCNHCGLRHQEDDKFCIRCGTPRRTLEISDVQKASPQQVSDVQKAPQHEVVDLTEGKKKQSDKGANDSTCGRPYQKKFLRCGWQALVDGSFIAPDGQEFRDRAAASRHRHAGKKLEPERKDGWVVVCNELRTHTDWIAPDGAKLQSYSSACFYGRTNNQPVLGLDGVQASLNNFFTVCDTSRKSIAAPQSGTATPERKDTPSRNSHTGGTSRKSITAPQSGTATPERKDTPSSDKQPLRKFTVPKQTASGARLQELCHMLERSGVTSTKRSALEREFEQYLHPRCIQNGMANKVLSKSSTSFIISHLLLCVVLQIVKCIVRDIFVYGNMFDTVVLLLKVFNTPEVRYLLKKESSLTFRDSRDTKAINAVFANVKTYLNELMAVKGSRNKLAAQTFRTVVAACSGSNLCEQRTLTHAGRLLVSAIFIGPYLSIYICFLLARCSVTKHPVGFFFL
jgi:hypothetical protein